MILLLPCPQTRNICKIKKPRSRGQSESGTRGSNLYEPLAAARRRFAGFKPPPLTTQHILQIKKPRSLEAFPGAEDGVRTRDLCLGKATLYQLSHSRIFSFFWHLFLFGCKMLLRQGNGQDLISLRRTLLLFPLSRRQGNAFAMSHSRISLYSML